MAYYLYLHDSFEAVRRVCAPLIPEIMHWSPKIPERKLITQFPESIFPLLPKALKLIQLLPKSTKILANSP